MKFNLSQNMATLLHLALAFVQICVVIWAPLDLNGKAEFIGFFSLCQSALGYRAFDLTPAGTPVNPPPGKQTMENQGK